MVKSWEHEINGTKLKLETGKMAKQANGSIMATYGDTSILVTATMSDPRPGVNFLPLMVNYEERIYAIGKIPGSVTRREGRPRDQATLNARLIDRPLRPLFPKGFRHDIQVVATILAVEDDNDPAVVAMNAASAALMISDIPFDGPIAGVRVGLIDGELKINPNEDLSEESDLDLLVAGTEEAVMMVEASANEVSEDIFLDALDLAHEEIKKLAKMQIEMRKEIGREKMEYIPPELPEEYKKQLFEMAEAELRDAVFIKLKQEREDAISEVKDKVYNEFMETLDEEQAEEFDGLIKDELDNVTKKVFREEVISNGKRPDGRNLDEVRPISTEIDLIPRVHGSGLFTRGETQALSVLTLGSSSDEQTIFGLGDDETKRFMHHYNFPPFCVGETSPMRGPGRREIGHGHLGEKAISPVLPSQEEFPYTIRLVSEVLESNGSSSQASICGSIMALMDGGVPISAPVSGIAMGLIKEDDDVAILSDIQGFEDHLGDMDFKVAGTKNGITALQMDIKVTGISKEIMRNALKQAKEGRLHILDKMSEAIAEPRPELSPNAPAIKTMKIDPEKIRFVIGPGGKMINKIIDETGAKIDIEDDGTVYVMSNDQEGGEKAQKMIEDLTRDVEVGEIYTGTVKKIMNFGAFAEILPGKEGLIHISELADYHVDKVEDIVSVGDEVPVKVIKIDNQDRINLSRVKALKELDEEDKE